MKTTLAILLSVALVSAFVAAIGTSTGGSPSPSRGVPPTTTDTETRPVPTSANLGVRPCADRETTRERILCRLQQKEQTPAGPEESCRGLANPERCAALYTNSDRCYSLEGRAKDACFKQVIGFSNSAVRDEASKNQENVRNYVVLLLYDLQERVENAHNEGTVSDDDAASLIDTIVTAKQAILTGKPRADIKTAIADVRATWQEVMQ